MKNKIISCILLVCVVVNVSACPTCIGKITAESPPLLQPEWYEKKQNTTAHNAQNVFLDLYDQYVKKKGNKK